MLRVLIEFIILSVLMLHVILPNVVMLNVMALLAMAPLAMQHKWNQYYFCHVAQGGQVRYYRQAEPLMAGIFETNFAYVLLLIVHLHVWYQ